MKNEKQGIISVKLSTGWEPWGIGTFMDGSGDGYGDGR